MKQQSAQSARQLRLARLTGLVASLGLCAAAPAAAAPAAVPTTLTVDLSKPIGPATHAANGSLYGLLETKPADVQKLIAPLHPRMFTNPAANVQQPAGDAIVVAARVASIGATVTIRFADWFPGWYSFTNMTDWFNKIDQTIARKKAAKLTNVYAYEIWNEPNGTWNSTSPNAASSHGSNLSFNAFWKQTYDHIRQLDPDVKITGPSLAGYNQSYLSAFLSYCKMNGCLPDIVGWHDGSDIQNNVNAYRALERQLGIGPLPITINEYSLTADITYEGEPGASATLIAAVERTRVDSACITFWDVAHPGRLGSLLATDTQTNGGWFFYKWYGEMTGQMLTTTSSLSSGNGNFDGFASLDGNSRTVSILAGGKSDGTIQIIVKGFKAIAAGSTVHAVVEDTPWTDRTTVVSATNTLSTSDLPVSGDQVSVTIDNANAKHGYHLTLSWPGDAEVDASVPASDSVDASTRDATVQGGVSSNAGSGPSTSSDSGSSAAVSSSSSAQGSSPTSSGSSENGSSSAGAADGTEEAPSSKESAGCSLRPVGRDEAPLTPWVGVAGLALLGLVRARRRKESGCVSGDQVVRLCVQEIQPCSVTKQS